MIGSNLKTILTNQKKDVYFLKQSSILKKKCFIFFPLQRRRIENNPFSKQLEMFVFQKRKSKKSLEKTNQNKKQKNKNGTHSHFALHISHTFHKLKMISHSRIWFSFKNTFQQHFDEKERVYLKTNCFSFSFDVIFILKKDEIDFWKRKKAFRKMV